MLKLDGFIRMVVAAVMLAMMHPVFGSDEPASLLFDESVLDEDAVAVPEAADPQRNRGRFSLLVENDARGTKFFHVTDRYYTHGTEMLIGFQGDLPDAIAPWMPFASTYDDPKTGMGFLLAGQIFTPEDIQTRNLIPDDRPYAGYLHTAVFWQRSDDVTLDHFQIELGLIGPSSGAEKAQVWVHKRIDANPVNGWDNQLRDELTFQSYFRKKWRFGTDFMLGDHQFAWQVVPVAGIALGTVHRYLEGGVMTRLGFNLPDDFGPARIGDPIDMTGDGAGRGFGAFIYGRLGGRAVEHNTLIEGNNYRSSHGRSLKHLIGEGQFGIGVSYRGDRFTIETTYGQTYVTEEFRGQNGPHRFGLWGVAVEWLF